MPVVNLTAGGGLSVLGWTQKIPAWSRAAYMEGFSLLRLCHLSYHLARKTLYCMVLVHEVVYVLQPRPKNLGPDSS